MAGKLTRIHPSMIEQADLQNTTNAPGEQADIKAEELSENTVNTVNTDAEN